MAEETKKPLIIKTDGNVTVDAEGMKNLPKTASKEEKAKFSRPISYNIVNLDQHTPDLAMLCTAIMEQGFSEDITFEGEGENRKSTGKSLVELLAQGLRTFNYTEAVALAKSRYNNSPAKVESSVTKELTELLNNPDATEAQKEKARKVLALLSA